MRAILHHAVAALALASAAVTLHAGAADATGADGGQAQYEKERAVCMSGKSNQDRATCLKEAGAARDQAKKGVLSDSGDYKKNALTRCNAVPDKDRADCMARIEGDSTTTSGTPSAGGVIRERVTKEPAPR